MSRKGKSKTRIARRDIMKSKARQVSMAEGYDKRKYDGSSSEGSRGFGLTSITGGS